MSARVKPQPDGYPVRYSLLPEERRTLLANLGHLSGITPEQIKKYATHYNVAAKTIHNLLTQHGLRILPSQDTPAPRQSSVRATAESFFRVIETNPEPVAEVIVPEAEDLTTLAELEIQLRREFSEQIRQLTEDRERAEAQLIATREEAETDLQIERDALAKAREQVQLAMEQTVQLRQRTKREREELEELRGNLSSFKRRYIRKVADVQFYHSELKESVTREKRLLEALRLSEDDLARCRAKSKK